MAPLLVFSMALFVAAVATTTVAHVTEEVQAATLVQKVWPLNEAYKGFQLLEQGSRNYLAAMVDANGYLVYPGDGAPVISALSPAYGFVPQNSEGYSWSVTTGTLNGKPGLGVCLQATNSNAQTLRFLTELRALLAPGTITQGNTCGALADAGAGPALTYWVPATASLPPPPPPDAPITPDSSTGTPPNDDEENEGKGHPNHGNSAIHTNAGGESASHANSNAPGQANRVCQGANGEVNLCTSLSS